MTSHILHSLIVWEWFNLRINILGILYLIFHPLIHIGPQLSALSAHFLQTCLMPAPSCQGTTRRSTRRRSARTQPCLTPACAERLHTLRIVFRGAVSEHTIESFQLGANVIIQDSTMELPRGLASQTGTMWGSKAPGAQGASRILI